MMMNIRKTYKCIFIILNSLIGLFAIKCHYNMYSLFTSIDDIYIRDFQFIDIFFFLFFIFIWYIFFYILDRLLNKKNKKNIWKISNKKLFIICILLFLILWSPYYLTFFPGGVYTDTYTEFYQAINTITGNGHNIFYILYIRLLYYICFKNSTIMFGLMTIIQLVLYILSFSYFIVWLKNKNVNKIVIILCIIFFGLYPRIPIYAISLWKDSLFSIFLFLYVLFLYDIISDKGKLLLERKNIIKYFILGILVSLFRNNGYYIVLIISLILFFIYRKDYKKIINYYRVTSILLLLLIVIYNIVFRILDYNPPYKESLGISLQQMGYVYALDNNIDDDSKEYLDELFNNEETGIEFKDIYSPMVSDPLKVITNNDYLVNNKKLYYKYYFKLMKNYPLDYFKEYLFETIGYWNYLSVVQGAGSDSLNDFYYNIDDYKDKDISNNINILDKLFNINISSYLTRIGKWLNNSAMGSLIMFIGLYILIVKNKLDKIIVYLPSLFIFIILLLGSPIAFSSRYIIYTIFFIPLSLIIPFIEKGSKI